MTIPTGQDLRSRIESYLADDGLECSQCVIALLRREVGLAAKELEAAALPLSKGLSATGGVCAAVTSGMIVLGSAFEVGPSEAWPRRPVPVGDDRHEPPLNDWLEVHPWQWVEPSVFSACRELFTRLSAVGDIQGGSLSCHDISGVDWSAPTEAQLARYHALDGERVRCVDMIAAAVETVAKLLRQTRVRTV